MVNYLNNACDTSVHTLLSKATSLSTKLELGTQIRLQSVKDFNRYQLTASGKKKKKKVYIYINIYPYSAGDIHATNCAIQHSFSQAISKQLRGKLGTGQNVFFFLPFITQCWRSCTVSHLDAAEL